MTDRKTTRVQMDMGAESRDRLDRLAQKTEAASHAEVMRKALKLYEIIVDAQAQNRELAFVDWEGTHKIVIV